ncbi:MAG TPA: hypothetical protein VMG34_01660 [Bacteroidota bacterium]|nr:hypothetical protein [Bacteroidota bacterium]
MKKTLLSAGVFVALFSGTTPVAVAQGFDDETRFERGDVDSLTSNDRFGSFIDDLIDDIQSGIRKMDRERDRDYDSDMDSAAVAKRYKAGSEAVTFTGNTMIDANDKIDGNVVVKGGSLTVTGLIKGDALAINGDIIVKDGGRITGNARSINGKVKREGNGTVDGYVEESSSVRDAVYERGHYRSSRSYRFNDLWLGESSFPDNVLFRYNRVEGLFLGLGSDKKFYWDGSKALSGYGSAGYGFKIHRWRLNLGVDREFASDDDEIFEFGAEGHSITDTKDAWLMKLSENNITALFWHEDYRDYFTREGFSVHAAHYTKESDLTTQIRVDYLIDDYSSLANVTDWSLFRQSHSFRENPAVAEGTMHSVLGTAGMSTLEREGRRTVGWNVYASLERGGDLLKGDFDFTRAIVDIRRFQPLSDYDKIDVRVRVASLQGDYIPQKTFEIGGANTLPAFAFKEFAGNRMILGNFEYILEGKVMEDASVWPRSLNFFLLADAGAADSVSTTLDLGKGFPSVNGKLMKSDVGFAVGWHDDSWRLGFAWRTDVKAPVSVFLRLNKPF